MPNPPQPQRPQHQSTSGPIEAVPCPWCNQPNDFRVLHDGESGPDRVSGWGSQGLETNATVDCDHCKRFSRVIAMRQVTIIKLQPTNPPKR